MREERPGAAVMIRSCACQRESQNRTLQRTCLAADASPRSPGSADRVRGLLGPLLVALIETPREGRSAFKLSDSALSLTMNTSYTQLYKSVYEPDIWLKAAEGKSSGPPVPALTSMLQALGNLIAHRILQSSAVPSEAAGIHRSTFCVCVFVPAG